MWLDIARVHVYHSLSQRLAHPAGLVIQGKLIPHMRADESYQYLGILVNLNLNWGEQWKSVLSELARKAPLITGCSGRPQQKLKLVESVMRSGIRYSMSVVPYTWEQIQGFHDILMTCARRSCGLSKRASTLLMMRGKGEIGGVGVDSVFHTYVYAQVDTVHELMEKLDDRGDIALGLWEAHAKSSHKNKVKASRGSCTTRLPILHVMSQLEEVGVRRVIDRIAMEHACRRTIERYCAEELTEPQEVARNSPRSASW